jgi:hypothetical protein
LEHLQHDPLPNLQHDNQAEQQRRRYQDLSLLKKGNFETIE